jgi:hypothetical protein
VRLWRFLFLAGTSANRLSATATICPRKARAISYGYIGGYDSSATAKGTPRLVDLTDRASSGLGGRHDRRGAQLLRGGGYYEREEAFLGQARADRLLGTR